MVETSSSTSRMACKRRPRGTAILCKRSGKPMSEVYITSAHCLMNQGFFLKHLLIQALNIGANVPAVATAKPMITYSCQPLANQLRSPNTRLSK